MAIMTVSMINIKLKPLAVAVLLISASQSHADSVNITESQKDEVKCVTLKDQAGKKYKSCSQVTTGSYSLTAKLSSYTFWDAGIYASDVTGDTPLGIYLGTFGFDGTLNSANKHKLTSRAIQGTWIKRHAICANPNTSTCNKYKQVTDETVYIGVGLSGVTITMTGKFDKENGQRVYSSLCEHYGTTLFTDSDATIAVNETFITSPIMVDCKVKKSVKVVGQQSFNLTNMTVKARLVLGGSFLSSY
jgi:hypothetical protein